MITDRDIAKLKLTFATKEDLKGYTTHNQLQTAVDHLIEYIDATRDSIIGEISAEFAKMSAQISSLTNEVQRSTIHTREAIDNHELRLAAIERKKQSN